MTDPFAIGHPRYRTQWSVDRHAIDVKLELEASPAVPGERRAEIAAHVQREVTRSRLDAALRDGSARLTAETVAQVRPDLIAQAHSGGVWSAD